MNVTGKCHCGRISYRAKIDPKKIILCHCTDCQVLSGCAYRVSARVAAGDFELLSGEPKVYVKTAESGNKRVQTFCGDCGTPFYAEALDNPSIRALRLGSVDQRAQILPNVQIWTRSALPWTEDLSAITPKHPRELV